MKTLILAPQLLPISGGVGAYTVELARRMPENVELTILTLRESGGAHDYDRLVRDARFPPNVDVVFIDTLAKGRFSSALSFQIGVSHICKKMVKEDVIDLVHTQSEMSDFLIRPSRLGVPIISTMHSTIQLHHEALTASDSRLAEMSRSERFVYLMGPAMNWLEGFYYTNERRYIAVSEWAKQKLVQGFGVQPTNITVIHNGVDAEFFHPAKRDECESNFPEIADIDVPKILFFSRIATRKGINNLLKAIPKVAERVDVHFILAGPGRLPQHDIPTRITSILGHVPHDLAPPLYASSDIFVLPSMNENFPISLLEAMASECCVAATNVGGIPEVVVDRQNGLLFNPGDVDALVEALILLIEDSEMRLTLGRKARETVLDGFKWSDTAARTAAHYQEVKSKHSQGR